MEYSVTFSCGHVEVVDLCGPRSSRERAIYVMENHKVCSECEKKKEEEAAKRAEEHAKEWGLPELTGSSKQIAWANVLRDSVLSVFEREAEELRQTEEYKANEAEYESQIVAAREYLYSQTTSRFWIDHRGWKQASLIAEALDLKEYDWYNYAYQIYYAAVELAKKNPTTQKKIEESKRALDAKEEATLYPQDQTTKDVAEIKVEGNEVVLISPKNDTIRNTIKAIGYKWDKDKNRWHFHLNATTGNSIDRLAETGNKLLNAGVPVLIFDETARDKAVSGDFEKLHPYWIVRASNKELGDIVAIWEGDISDKLYRLIKSLPKSRYSNGMIYLNSKYYDEIRDFAEIHNFKITPQAEEVLEEAELKATNRKKVRAADVGNVEEEDNLEAILNSSRDILDDLRDED